MRKHILTTIIAVALAAPLALPSHAGETPKDNKKTFNPVKEKIDGDKYTNYMFGFELYAAPKWNIVTTTLMRESNSRGGGFGGSVFSGFSGFSGYGYYRGEDYNPVEYDDTIMAVMKEPLGAIIEDNPILTIKTIDIKELPQKPTTADLENFMTIILKKSMMNFYLHENGKLEPSSVPMVRLVFSGRTGMQSDDKIKVSMYLFLYDENTIFMLYGAALEYTFDKYLKDFDSMASSFKTPATLKQGKDAFFEYGRGQKYMKNEKGWEDSDHEKAIERLNKAIELNPSLKPAHGALMQIYTEEKEEGKLEQSALKYFTTGDLEDGDYEKFASLETASSTIAGKVSDALNARDNSKFSHKLLRAIHLKKAKDTSEHLQEIEAAIAASKNETGLGENARKQIDELKRWAKTKNLVKEKKEEQKKAAAKAGPSWDDNSRKLFMRAIGRNKVIEAYETLGNLMRSEELYARTGMANYLEGTTSQISKLEEITEAISIACGSGDIGATADEIKKAFQGFKTSEEELLKKSPGANSTGFFDRPGVKEYVETLKKIFASTTIDNASLKKALAPKDPAPQEKKTGKNE